VKYSDDLLLQAEEVALLSEIGRYCGMKVNLEKLR
jgi:hypothetical protein